VGNLIESTLLSLDGVMGDPTWAMKHLDEEAQADAFELIAESAAMLMGRNTYLALSGRWQHESGPFAERMNTIPKYVFSATLDELEWKNAELVREDPVGFIRRLRDQGGDLVIYGHGKLAQALLEADLLDEMRLRIHPLLAGKGQLLLRDGVRVDLELVHSKIQKTGVALLHYRRLGARKRS
jgi:dihydrofolate reductase